MQASKLTPKKMVSSKQEISCCGLKFPNFQTIWVQKTNTWLYKNQFCDVMNVCGDSIELVRLALEF